MAISYKDSGVDIEAGYEVVKSASKRAKSTYSPQVLSGIGGFGAAFALKELNYKDPVLVSGADGVGTKVKIAFEMNKHDTVGIDLVAMNVDDVVTLGARPLFLLDYIGCNKVVPSVMDSILIGVAEGCKQAGCSLIGGETAELSDLYAPNEYDLAGFAVGIVERKKMLTPQESIKAGTVLIGIASSGLHSNGYTLARKLMFEVGKFKVTTQLPELGTTVGEALLTPTKIYCSKLVKLFDQFEVLGCSHITGGGLPENVERILPKGLKAVIEGHSWEPGALFQVLKELGKMELSEMYKAFNMGIGMVLAVKAKDANGIIQALKKMGEPAYIIGQVVKGNTRVEIN
jgi:phosphoribosylformylglycinamidine cyclo-ligase